MELLGFHKICSDVDSTEFDGSSVHSDALQDQGQAFEISFSL